MKAIVVILSAALVALGGVAIHLSRQLDASRQQVADMQALVGTAEAPAAEMAALRTPPSLPTTEPSSSASAHADVAYEESLRASIATRGSPESRAQVKAAMMSMMVHQYPDLGRVLGISRDQVDRLLDVFYEQRNRRSGIDTHDAAAMARVAQADREELRTLLGSKYAKWEEYSKDLLTRRQVRDLAVALNSAGTPLTDAQVDSLIPAVAAAERRNVEDLPNMPAEDRPSSFLRYSPEGNRRILDAAAAYLTPQQQESYSQVLERALIQEVALRQGVYKAQREAEQSRQGQR